VKWKIFLLIAVISSAVYANSFQNSFHFDDQHFIVENTYIRDIRNIPSFFFSPNYLSFEKAFTSHYRPLLVTSYAINYALGGLQPAGYHVVNLLFHVGSAFLVYLILDAMLLTARHPELVSGSLWFIIPIATALIFAVHPFNSEVVNYITARSSVMCSFFYLMSFYFWIRFRSQKGSYFYIISLLAFILAMLTKEIAITLPLMLFLYDFYFLRGSLRRYLAYLPYVLLVIVPYLAYRIVVYGHIVGGTRPYMQNMLTQTTVLLKYIQLMFLPVGLTIDHDIKSADTILNGTVIVAILLLLLVIAATYVLFRLGREWRVVSFFILWFFITLLPTTVIPLNAILQENRGYLGGIVSAVIAGVLISRIKRIIVLPALIVLIIALSILTVQRNIVWRNDLSLWNDAVAKSPLSARAHDNLGLAWMGIKKYDLALDEFNKTLDINPQYYLAYYNAGVIYQLQGDLERARWAYEESLKISPGYFRSYYNVGIVYKKIGALDKAVSSYEKAIALDPRHPFVYNNLGVILIDKGELKKAEAVFIRAIGINPRYEKAYYNLGNVYFRAKEYGRAAEAYKAAVRIRPDYKEADEMLREALARK